MQRYTYSSVQMENNYTGKFSFLGKNESLQGDVSVTAGVVLQPVEPLCGLGNHLYMGNL